MEMNVGKVELKMKLSVKIRKSGNESESGN